ncbi:MAG: hypothetical protein AAF138_05010 [Planctomycetota bacterium]
MVVVLDPAYELRTYLKDRDAPCPRCGYNLRDLQRTSCPECGLPLRIDSIRRASRRGRTQTDIRVALPWVGWIGAGVAVWGLVVGILFRSMRTSGALPSWFYWLVMAPLGVVMLAAVVGCLIWLARARARDRRHRRNAD